MIKEAFKLLELDRYEFGIIINSLTSMRNNLIKEKKETKHIDDVLLKVLNAKEKKRFFSKGFFLEGR